MGYQETLFYLTPQRRFNDMVLECLRLKLRGFFQEVNTYPVAVVTLKKPVCGIASGSKVLWVCGERCFQTEDVMLPIMSHRHKLRIIPLEEFVKFIHDLDDVPCCENFYMSYQSFDYYIEHLPGKGGLWTWLKTISGRFGTRTK